MNGLFMRPFFATATWPRHSPRRRERDAYQWQISEEPAVYHCGFPPEPVKPLIESGPMEWPVAPILRHSYIIGIYKTMLDLDHIEGFDWDEGNERKSQERHSVGQSRA